ncbi:MAG: hypothetical protein FWD47_10155 [Treponema sp.]|nr:hypothetical protein [Treponema sp.]
METIKVLLLDDLPEDVAALKQVLERISKDIEKDNVKLDLLFQPETIIELVGDFVSCKKLSYDLSYPCTKRIDEKIDIVNNTEKLVCVIDIVWGGKKNEYNELGCDFYSQYLTTNPNVVFITIVPDDKWPERLGKGTKCVSKTKNKEPMSENFISELRDAILDLPIVKNNMSSTSAKETWEEPRLSN